MSRIKFAAEILSPLNPTSILDVGCRDASLADEFPTAEYAGADLNSDTRGRVKYVGDIARISLDRKFDAVVALDVLEHLDNPSEVFDRLADAAQRIMLVSLPNTYDLKSRIQFVFTSGLGDKYRFLERTPTDRHRWLMNRAEISAFYAAKAARHGLTLQVIDLRYGRSGNLTLSSVAGRLLSCVLPPSFSAQTILGLFLRT